MKAKSIFYDKISKARKICCGDVFEEAFGERFVSKDLDCFSLHDYLLYCYEFKNEFVGGSYLAVSGLAPSFSEIIEINFSGVSGFRSSGFNPADFFSIRELKFIKSELEGAFFDGDFDGQFFQFYFKEAKFIRLKLPDPVLRCDLNM